LLTGLYLPDAQELKKLQKMLALILPSRLHLAVQTHRRSRLIQAHLQFLNQKLMVSGIITGPNTLFPMKKCF